MYPMSDLVDPIFEPPVFRKSRVRHRASHGGRIDHNNATKPGMLKNVGN